MVLLKFLFMCEKHIILHVNHSISYDVNCEFIDTNGFACSPVVQLSINDSTHFSIIYQLHE